MRSAPRPAPRHRPLPPPPPADISQRVVGCKCLCKFHSARFIDAFSLEVELCHCEPPRNKRPMVMRTAHAGQTDVSLPVLRTVIAQMATAGSLASEAAAHRVPGCTDAACCRESKARRRRGRQRRKSQPRPASAWLQGTIATGGGAAAVGANPRGEATKIAWTSASRHETVTNRKRRRCPMHVLASQVLRAYLGVSRLPHASTTRHPAP